MEEGNVIASTGALLHVLVSLTGSHCREIIQPYYGHVFLLPTPPPFFESSSITTAKKDGSCSMPQTSYLLISLSAGSGG